MLTEKTAIITGASMGLGEEIAKLFISNGANVLLCARNENSLRKVCEELKNNRVTKDQIIDSIYSYTSDVSWTLFLRQEG